MTNINSTATAGTNRGLKIIQFPTRVKQSNQLAELAIEFEQGCYSGVFVVVTKQDGSVNKLDLIYTPPISNKGK